MHTYRDIGQATDEQLAGIRDAVTQLMSFDRFIGSDMLTGLCVLREAAVAVQNRRAGTAGREQVHLRPVRSA